MAHENATPRPWVIDASLPDFIRGADDTMVAMVLDIDGATETANAALICKSVNAYDTLRAQCDALREENERVVSLLREATADIVWSAYHQGIEKGGKWMDAARSDARQLQHDLGLEPGWHDAAEIKRRIPEATEIALKRVMEPQS